MPSIMGWRMDELPDDMMRDVALACAMEACKERKRSDLLEKRVMDHAHQMPGLTTISILSHSA
jgi:hypothetical protein